VLFDSWYASLRNLKSIRDYGWHWLTRLKSNRLVNPDGEGNIPISQVAIPPEGRVVHLKGYGFIKVFRTVSQNGGEEYWASDLQMDEERGELESQGRGIEVCRGIKQCSGIEQAQIRKAVVQKDHFLYALRAFLRLEMHRLRRATIPAYLTHSVYSLTPTA
jgi:hypothetical protein